MKPVYYYKERMNTACRAAIGRVARDIRVWWKFGAALLLYDIAVQLAFGEFCPSVIVTGLPCPGCGMTRAVCCFLTGQFARGWTYHPLAIGWILWGICAGISRYLLGRGARSALYAAGMLAGLMAIFYLWRMYRYFPGEEPIVYTAGNLLERRFPGYGEWVTGLIGSWRARLS